MSEQEYVFKDVDSLKEFIEQEVITTHEVAEMLGCTRQNIKQLVDYKTLVPVKQTSRERLFFKADVIEYKNKREASK